MDLVTLATVNLCGSLADADAIGEPTDTGVVAVGASPQATAKRTATRSPYFNGVDFLRWQAWSQKSKPKPKAHPKLVGRPPR